MNEYVLIINEKEYRAEVGEINAEYALVQVNDREYRVDLKQLALGKLIPAEVKRGEVPVTAPTAAVAPAARMPLEPPPGGGDVASVVGSPLPGLILDVNVKEGDKVKAGQNIIIMEAMKMENQIQATSDGTVKKVFVKKGDNVSEGDALIEIARSDMARL